MNILFLGPPGSGKGTQGQLLEKNGNFIHFSTGDILRKEIENKTQYGTQISQLIDKGQFISNDLMIDLLKNKVINADHDKNIIFDGFPRTLEQIQPLENMLKDIGQKIDFAIYFSSSYAVLKNRILGRFSCSKCGEGYNEFSNMPTNPLECNICHSHEFSKRKDDLLDIFEKRYKIYQELTDPIKEVFKKQGKLVYVNADENINNISHFLDDILMIHGFKINQSYKNITFNC